MTTYQPIDTLADLDALDEAEIVAGYLDHERGDPEPGANRSRAYWHGWCNRARDRGEMPPTAESAALARALLERQRPATPSGATLEVEGA